MAQENPNRLVHEKSPYLLQHAYNPVDWFPWGEEAFEKARAENKPIFLSIGYATCHWCHVMERESFENDSIAAYLNEHFVSIKLDREERPDVDMIYMTAVRSMTGQGGWPLTVFLNHELEPFFGGTYFPPQNIHGKPSAVVTFFAGTGTMPNNSCSGYSSTGSSRFFRNVSTPRRLPMRETGHRPLHK